MWVAAGCDWAQCAPTRLVSPPTRCTHEHTNKSNQIKSKQSEAVGWDAPYLGETDFLDLLLRLVQLSLCGRLQENIGVRTYDIINGKKEAE